MSVEVRRFRVVGLVQGVGFRWFVRETARALHLAGWVRNEADGSVLVIAAGGIDELARLEAALHVGPPGARVAQLDVAVPSDSELMALTRNVASPDALPRPFQVVRERRDA